MNFKLLIALVAFFSTLVLAQGNDQGINSIVIGSSGKPAGMPPAPTIPPPQMGNMGGADQRKPITPGNPVTPTPANNVGKESSSGKSGSVGAVSDQRLKRDIHQLTTMPNGIKLYSFKYLWSDDVYVGVMAQDLLSNSQWKDAVIASNTGYYSVDYSKLGTHMMTLEQYQLQQLQSNVAVTN